ncbi:Cycloeucalenol cycloisomerase [Galdieria sulphuraria]|uniref:Cycloeucalenol cycloisomerase n=1 Tax=Galdieria sulphuraria TaxID=130081 RepID=M2WWG4_GALSU|nr:cycloeucalenol cycloisomerase [Galdieria sulphuraria]EME28340.1 cycloeucalenol cycloisomerase [Galdieria sulphuraria]GJD12524.1 Cycloeucalenol cycloisomerase [Galdieria sulphuraria]|eukprot:XP_005704860.1 cycloeucalenol cycloisomerase [Galdieria sulphuraria]
MATRDPTPSNVVSKQKLLESWFAADESKRWCEKVFLVVTPLSIASLVLGLVGSKGYKYCGKNEYLLFSLLMAAPCFIVPLLLSCSEDKKRAFSQRFWIKANLWNLVFGYIGNYFWTHYFYQLLGAHYTFESYYWNHVPIPCYLATHAYFCFYHTFATIILRRVVKSTERQSVLIQTLIKWLFILLLAYATAVAETVTIAWFPYYSFDNWEKMVYFGSVFYAIYFVVSFPMYYRIDEDPQHDWNLTAVVLDSFAAAMIVTVLLDLWRIFIGSLNGSQFQGIPFIL